RSSARIDDPNDVQPARVSRTANAIILVLILFIRTIPLLGEVLLAIQRVQCQVMEWIPIT
ncbi:MAG: hypothetical protein AABZ18_06375, partial [Pseudomonadota bacterium]